MPRMKIKFLGTGASHGIPAIACACPVCRSENPRNRRARSHVWIEAGAKALLVDTPADLRAQVLRFDLTRVDGVLLTHEHADHIFGFDDLRRFSYARGSRIPVFGSPVTVQSMRAKFSYLFTDTIWRKTVPQVDFVEVETAFTCGDIEIEPVEVPHGPMTVFGYVLRHDGRSLGYFPDCSAVNDALARRLKGLDVMVLDALQSAPHPTHLCLDQSIDALLRIGAKRSLITHLSHDLEHDTTQAKLPAGIKVAYDGLELEW